MQRVVVTWPATSQMSVNNSDDMSNDLLNEWVDVSNLDVSTANIRSRINWIREWCYDT